MSVVGEERRAEPAGLPQRRRGSAVDDAGADLSYAETLTADGEPIPKESLLRVLEGLKRL